MRYLVIDTETGGLDPKKNALLEIGARIFEEDGKICSGFHRKIMWDSSMSTTVTIYALGLNKSSLIDGDSAPKVANDLAAWLACWSQERDIVLMGQNLQFDCDFLTAFMERYGFVNWMEPFRHRKIDTCHIALYLQEVGLLPAYLKLGLAALHKHFFGTDLPAAHTAMGDAESTFAVYREMRRLMRERVSWDSTVAIGAKKP